MSCRPWLPARPPSRSPSCHLRTDRSSGFQISSSLPCLWGLSVCLCVSTCLCVLVCTSSRRSRQGGLCGFGLRELVSRQWLWQPARPTIPGGREGCRRDTLDLLVQWRLWRKRPLRPAFGTLAASPTATLRPEEGPCPLGKVQMSRQGPASLPLHLCDGGTMPSLMEDKRPPQIPLDFQI